jgi:hypothetical protein
MATLNAQAPDGKTLTINVPDGTDPSNYPAMVDDAVQHYTAATKGPQSSLPSYASPAQQQAFPWSSLGAKTLGVGMEALQAPLQAVGEPIRRAITQAEGTNPGPYRIPTILQRLLPSMQTPQQAPDMFSAAINPAYAALKAGTQGATSLIQGKGVDQAKADASAAFNQPPGLPEAALSTAAAIGSGEAGNVPYKAIATPFVELGKAIESGELAGVPGIAALAKAKAGADWMPFGLENLTAKANPDIQALQKSADPKVAAAANSLMPAAVTGSPTLSAIEGLLSKSPFASNIMRPKFTETLNALNNLKEPLVEDAKPAADLGLDIQQALSNSSNMAYKNAQSLYDNAGAAVPQGTHIPLNNVSQTASDLMQAQAKLPPGAQVSKAMPLLRDLAGAGFEGQDVGQTMPGGMPAAEGQASSGVRGSAVPQLDYPTIQALRSELNSKIAEANSALGSASPGAKFQSSPEAGIYGKLKNALDQDLTSFSNQTGGAFKSALDQANATYSTYKQAYNNDKFVQSILNEQNPEKVVDKIMSAATDNPRALGTLKLNLPTDTLNDLQTTFIKNMMEKNPNEFSPSYFVQQYNKIGEKRLTDILGPDKLAQISPLYTISKAAQQAEQMGQTAMGPSGSGVASAMFLRAPITGTIAGLATGSPLKGAAAGAAELGAELEVLPLLAKAYTSGPGRAFLTRQAGLMPSFPNAAQTAQTAGKINPPIQELIKQLQQKYAQRNQ